MQRRQNAEPESGGLRVRPPTPERVKNALAAIGLTPITDIVSWKDGVISIADSAKLSEWARLSIIEIKHDIAGNTTFKMANKMPALDLLAKHFGLLDNKPVDPLPGDESTSTGQSVYNTYNVVVTERDIEDAFASIGKAEIVGLPRMGQSSNGTDSASLRPPQA